MTAYSPPVAKLLTLGKPALRKDDRQDYPAQDDWLDYPAQGLDESHIPELIALATDAELHFKDEDVEDIWGPIHALRALGQLRAVAAIERLLPMFESMQDSDWAMEDLTHVYGRIGPAAIEALTRFLEQPGHDGWAYIKAAECLKAIAATHPQVREQCVAVLTERLWRFEENEWDVNGFFIDYLVDLRAVDALPAIRAAFEADAVESFVMGDLEDVEIELGVRTERSTPKPRFTLFPMDEENEWRYSSEHLPAMPPLTPEEKAAFKKDKAKTKAKRKAAKQARKKNVKKKKR